jgi:hypothetical protein
MAKPFNELRERLLRAGVAPRHVRRYLTELGEHLADLRAEEERAGKGREDAEAAALARLGGMGDLAKAMIEQRQFQAWSVRALWALFSLGPVALMAATYVVACLILWSGWKIFLPGTASPFVKVDGWAGIYFGLGRMIYFGAPVLVGWAVGLTAARQRVKAGWLVMSLVLIALLGTTAHVQTSGPDVPWGAGHVGMGIGAVGFADGFSRAAVILLFAALPYLAWRAARWLHGRNA